MFKFDKKRDYTKAGLGICIVNGTYELSIWHPKRSVRGRPFWEHIETFDNLEDATQAKIEFSKQYNIHSI